jgi:hypothetical protein
LQNILQVALAFSLGNCGLGHRGVVVCRGWARWRHDWERCNSAKKLRRRQGQFESVRF